MSDSDKAPSEGALKLDVKDAVDSAVASWAGRMTPQYIAEQTTAKLDRYADKIAMDILGFTVDNRYGEKEIVKLKERDRYGSSYSSGYSKTVADDVLTESVTEAARKFLEGIVNNLPEPPAEAVECFKKEYAERFKCALKRAASDLATKHAQEYAAKVIGDATSGPIIDIPVPAPDPSDVWGDFDKSNNGYC